MNTQTLEILNNLKATPFINQRVLAENCGISLGSAHKSLKSLADGGYIDSNCTPTEAADALFDKSSPKNAIILAAGFGMRMVPINTEYPKALIEVKGEPLIERLIRQLNAAGITDISVVVGFMKESFEYLIDSFGVKLVVNRDYAVKNNLHSLACATRCLGNTYIVPCDMYFTENPFRKNELYSWYGVTEKSVASGEVRLNRKNELIVLPSRKGGNEMIGVCYLTADTAAEVAANISVLTGDSGFDDAFWEEALYKNGRMLTAARVFNSSAVTEINTYEQLRDFDSDSRHLKSEAINIAANATGAKTADIKEISVLKKGMTNRSFLFESGGQKYVMRIPGEGTDKLINRQNEAAVFAAIKGRELCDDPVYINPENGYKITRFISDARPCDSENEDDLQHCMQKLRNFHEMRLSVPHEFSIFGNIDFYEQLMGGSSMYRDYEETKKNVLSLIPFIEQNISEKVLCHIDSVPDNFLFDPHIGGELGLQLTDWEYAGMQDPHVDIAMFCIYSLYEKPQIDRLIDIYFCGKCPENIRTKIYCYIAACGLLWSNWCEYKHHLGVEFGEYALAQYRFAKEYYRIAAKRIAEKGDENA